MADYLDHLTFQNMEDGDAFVRRLPGLLLQFQENHGQQTRADRTLASLDRVEAMLADLRSTEFEHVDTEELVQQAFAYISDVYLSQLPDGYKVEASRRLFEANGKTVPVIPLSDTSELDPASYTAILMYKSIGLAKKVAKQIEQAAVPRSELPSLRTSEPPTVLAVSEADGHDRVVTELSKHFSDINTDGTRIVVAINSWRMQLVSSQQFDAELIADKISAGQFDGTVPDPVVQVWELTTEPDTDMTHFNDTVMAIQAIEATYTRVATITR